VRQISRRRLLVTGAAGAAGAAAVGGVGLAAASIGDGSGSGSGSELAADARGVVPFHGAHQAGIATEQQDRLLFASYDVTVDGRDGLAELLRDWTAAAARLTAGEDVGPAAPVPDAPPTDTGEAAGLDPARLTLTFGFGPSLFSGRDRFGLARHRPEALADLPDFPGDALDPDHSGGDLCVQACSNDPQVAYHAIRNLTRIGRGRVLLRWTQVGFGRTSSTTSSQLTPRNLMGFKDGTNNLRAGTDQLDRAVWVPDDGDPAWMRGGTYLVARRIRIFIEVWDRSSLADQEATIGRTRHSGAPLGGRDENDPLDLDATGDDDQPVIPVDAHVRLANQAAHDIFLLRRGYSFTDGIDRRTGQLDAGLFFLAFQADPHRQFVPLQDALARNDALNEYIQHVGSALFAIPPGAAEGAYVGQPLFEA
jgi:deferrochelatase/peroxidase EfeB